MGRSRLSKRFSPVPTKDPPDRRSQHPGARRQIHRTALRGAPQPTDPLLDSRRCVEAASGASCDLGSPQPPCASQRPHHFATVPRDSPHLTGDLGLNSHAATPMDQHRLPAGVKRALACDIEPPVLVGSNTTTRTGDSPHHAATNLYAQSI